MWQDPIVEELHRQRRQRSDQFKQDLPAMAEDARKRAQKLAPAKRVKRPARTPKQLPDAA